MIGRLNHVAIAVPDLEAATAIYRDTLGATVSAQMAEPEHGVTVRGLHHRDRGRAPGAQSATPPSQLLCELTDLTEPQPGRPPGPVVLWSEP